MKKNTPRQTMNFSRRESEVMDVLFQKRSATAREIWSALGETRTYSTIRKLLSILEEKGHVTHRKEGLSFIYSPRMQRDKAASSALGRLVDTFFEGSVAGAVSSLLGERGENVSPEELERISQLIDEAKQKNGGARS
ncbi:MAG: BlaI/MecI/CopY family transcriptional regulator [Verrucomicrobiota bacterium]